MTKDCRSDWKCEKCYKKQSTLFHFEKKNNEANPNRIRKDQGTQSNEDSSSQATPAADSSAQVMYSAIREPTKTSMRLCQPVYVSSRDHREDEILTYAMLDQQSDTTFNLDSTCDKLNTTGTSVSLLVSTLLSQEKRGERFTSSRIFWLEVIDLPTVQISSGISVSKDNIPTEETARN